MTTKPSELPIGDPLSIGDVHHMPESYYDAWTKARKAEQRAWRSGNHAAWIKASQRLTSLENAHDTN